MCRSYEATKRVGAMHISGESLLVILIIGLVAGWLAGKIVEGSGFRADRRHGRRHRGRPYWQLANAAIRHSYR